VTQAAERDLHDTRVTSCSACHFHISSITVMAHDIAAKILHIVYMSHFVACFHRIQQNMANMAAETLMITAAVVLLRPLPILLREAIIIYMYAT